MKDRKLKRNGRNSEFNLESIQNQIRTNTKQYKSIFTEKDEKEELEEFKVNKRRGAKLADGHQITDIKMLATE